MRVFTLIGILIAGLCLSLPAQEELVRNGSFEEGLSGWEVPAWVGSALPPAVERSQAVPPGLCSLFIAADGKRPGLLMQKIDFPEDLQSYRISGYIKTAGMNSLPGQAAYAMIQLRGRSKLNDGESKELTLWSQHTPPLHEGGINLDWRCFEGTFKLTPQHLRQASLYLKVSQPSQGKIWFDRISISPLTENPAMLQPSPENPVPLPENPLLSENGVDILNRTNSAMSPQRWYRSGGKPVYLEEVSGPQWPGGRALHAHLSPGKQLSCSTVLIDIRENCQGTFRLSALVRKESAEANCQPLVSVTVTLPGNDGSTNFAAVPVNDDAPNDWQKVAVQFTAPPGTRRLTVNLGQRGKAETPVSIWFANLKLERLVLQQNQVAFWQFENGGVWGMFRKGETPQAKLYFENSWPEARKLKVSFRIRNISGQELDGFEQTLDMPALSLQAYPVAMKAPDRFGFYSVFCSWQTTGLRPETFEYSFLVVDSPPEKPDPFFGITFASPCYPEAIRMLGFGSKGISIDWRTIELEDGSYDWSGLDWQVEQCLEQHIKPIGGIRVYGFLNMYPDHWGRKIKAARSAGKYPYDEEFYQAAERFVTALVTRYKGKIREWSAVNEINLSQHHDQYEYQHYIRRVKELSGAVRKADPDAVLLGIGVSGGDGRTLPRFRVMKALWDELHEYLDGVGPDLYTSPNTWGPGYDPANSESGNFGEMLRDALEIVQSKAKNIVAVDEKGCKVVYDLPVSSPYAVSAANIQAREYIIAKSFPEVRHWLYFWWARWRAEDALDYGIWRDNSPRPMAATFAAVSRLLAGMQSAGTVELHKDIPFYLFRNEDHHLGVLWSNVATSVLLSPPADSVLTGYDAEGNPLKYGQGSRIELKLGEAPVYLDFGSAVQSWVSVFRKADISLPELQAAAAMSLRNQLEITVQNLTDRQLACTVNLPDLQEIKHTGSVLLPALGENRISIPMTAPPPQEKFNPLNFTIVSQSDRSYNFQQNFTLLPIPRIQQLEDIRKLEPIVLNSPEKHLSSIDFAVKGLWDGIDDLSADIRLAWDNAYFHLLVQVRDDIMNNTARGYVLWSGDSIQFAFNTRNNAAANLLRGISGLDADDYLFTAGIGNQGPELFCHFAARDNLAEMGDRSLGKTNIIRDEKTKTTEYFISLPWAKLAPLSPEKGRVFRFNCLIMDSDVKGQSSPYWMQITPGIAGALEPARYLDFVLE